MKINSILNARDEWDKIERFNALAEEYDKHMKAVNMHTSQRKLQESLRKQIQEQKRMKVSY